LALTDSPPQATVPSAPAVRVRRRKLLGSRRRQILAGLVIAGSIGFVVAEGLGNATQYYQTVPQAYADKAKLGVSQFRIMGYVDNDIRQVGHTTEFSIHWGGETAQIQDTADPPQLFKPEIPVVLEGHWAATGNVFDSDLIMVKHTADYTPPTDPATAPSRTSSNR
jgi:cytochrome c-type biogenesis protein CcmE